MNISSAFKLSAMLLPAVLVVPLLSKYSLPRVQAHEANEGCSLATLKGAYGAVLKGQVLGVGPIVGIGLSTFDGRGNFVANPQTLNVNGNVFEEPGTGTYTVNHDCTGIATPVGAGPHSFVIVADGNEMHLMDNNSAEVLTIDFTKVSSDKDDH